MNPINYNTQSPLESRRNHHDFPPFFPSNAFGGRGKGNHPIRYIALFCFCIILLLICFTKLDAQSRQSQSPFEQLKQKFESGQIFEADFTHQYVDSYTQDTVQNSGEIWIGKEQYKVESPGQLVAIDGELSKVYDSDRNRVIISEYVPEEDDFAPSRILNGIDSTYTIGQQQKQGNRFMITLRSDDPFALFQEVQITLNDNLIPLKIFVRDPGENLITTTFSGGSFVNRKKTIFELEYPSDAEVIDMRN